MLERGLALPQHSHRGSLRDAAKTSTMLCPGNHFLHIGGVARNRTEACIPGRQSSSVLDVQGSSAVTHCDSSSLVGSMHSATNQLHAAAPQVMVRHDTCGAGMHSIHIRHKANGRTVRERAVADEL